MSVYVPRRILVERELLRRIVQLAQRNIERADGEKLPESAAFSGFSNHPDYAELGRIVASNKLLALIEKLPAPTPILQW